MLSAAGGSRGPAVWGQQKNEGKHTTPFHATANIHKRTQSHNNTYNKSSIPISRLLIQLASIQQFQQIKNIFSSFFPFSSLENTILLLCQHEISYSFSIMSFLIHTNITHIHINIYIYINVRFCFHCFLLVLLFSSSFPSFFAFFSIFVRDLGLLLDSKKNSNYIYYSNNNIVSSAHARL